MASAIQDQTKRWLDLSVQTRGEIPPFKLGSVSRAWTPEETKDALLSWMVNNAEYWADVEGKTKREALHGAMFSTCAMLDGSSIGMPAFDLYPSPAEEDKKYWENIGGNYFDPKVSALTGQFSLHDEYHSFERLFQEERQERNFKKEPGVPFRYVLKLEEYIGVSNTVLRAIWAGGDLDKVLSRIERLPLMSLGKFESPMNGHQHTLADMVKFNGGWPVSSTTNLLLTEEEQIMIDKIAV